MKRSILVAGLTLACATGASAPSVTSYDHGSLALHQLVHLLDGNPVSPTSPANDKERLAWFLDTSLDDAGNYREAAQAYHSGQPVAIIRGPRSASTDLVLQELFSAASPAPLAIYVKTADGTPHIVTAETSDCLPSQCQMLARHMGRTVREAMAVRKAQATTMHAPSPQEQVAVPQLVFTNTQFGNSGNGSAVTLRAEISRSVGPSFNVLQVVARSVHVLRPHENGAVHPFVVVPDRYAFQHTVRMDQANSGSPKLLDWLPKSDANTDLDISETHTTMTSIGSGFSQEASNGLQGKVTNFAAKKAFSFNFGREVARSSSVAFKIKDYAVQDAFQSLPDGSLKSQWTLPLAGFVAGDDRYFGNPPTTQKMTSTMRQSTPVALSEWSVPGTYRNRLTIGAAGSIQNRRYLGFGSSTAADPDVQPGTHVTVDTRSVYLTPEPTVFIQSKANNGECLRDKGGTIINAPCPDVSRPGWISDIHAQWQFDLHGRYYNRGSGQCMQVLANGQAAGSHVVTRPCTTNRDQQWEWIADRIYSRHGDGAGEWRLFLSPDDNLQARTHEDPRLQPLPGNAFHPLLKPWSNYPKRPFSNDYIPKLENIGPNQPIPPEYLHLGRVLPEERWEVVVLRQSLVGANLR